MNSFTEYIDKGIRNKLMNTPFFFTHNNKSKGHEMTTVTHQSGPARNVITRPPFPPPTAPPLPLLLPSVTCR